MSESPCCLHIEGDAHEDTPKSLSEKAYQKVAECSARWLTLHLRDNADCEVAAKFDRLSRHNEIQTLQYHKKCYARFTNVERIRRAERKISSNASNSGSNAQTTVIKVNVSSKPALPRRKRPSAEQSEGPGPKKRSEHVLPRRCIICKKEKFVRDKNSAKRVRERLSDCEYMSGGLFLKAAELLNDESILVDVRGRDLVAVEVRYHRSCFKSYTRFLYESGSESTIKSLYGDVFNTFCEEIVEERIIRRGEAINLSSLRHMFVETSARFQFSNSPTMTHSAYLKMKLKARYPDLEFIKNKKSNRSEMFFSKSARCDLAQELCSSSDDDDFEEYLRLHQAPVDVKATRDMYRTALFLRGVISGFQGCEKLWPPTSVDFDLSVVKKAIPEKLYNFLAWIVDASTDFVDDGLVPTSEYNDTKILSICQDIISLSTRGKKQTPKHLALGMTIRHLTGSSALIDLLHGLGHSASYSTVLEHDSALTSVQPQKSSIIPFGFQKGTPSILVWDNNDFLEETRSGEGTTHNTNGILIQKLGKCTSSIGDRPLRMAKSKKRSAEVLSSFIIPYYGNRQEGPVRILTDTFRTSVTTSQEIYFRRDLGYVWSKIPDCCGNIAVWWFISKGYVEEIMSLIF